MTTEITPGCKALITLGHKLKYHGFDTTLDPAYLGTEVIVLTRVPTPAFITGCSCQAWRLESMKGITNLKECNLLRIDGHETKTTQEKELVSTPYGTLELSNHPLFKEPTNV